MADCVSDIALLMRQDAKQVKCIRIVGIGVKHLLEKTLGFVKLALGPVLLGQSQTLLFAQGVVCLSRHWWWSVPCPSSVVWTINTA